MLQSSIAVLLSGILFVLSGIHFYWAWGGRWAAGVVVPARENGQKVFEPRPFETIIVAFSLMCTGIYILIRASLIRVILPHWLMQYGLYILGGLFLLRAIGEGRYVGFFKRIRKTTFGQLDTKYFSPFCLLLSILFFVLSIMLKR